MTFQNSVEWRPSTGTGRESTTAPEEEDDVMMMMEEERQQPQAASEDDEDENLNFPHVISTNGRSGTVGVPLSKVLLFFINI